MRSSRRRPLSRRAGLVVVGLVALGCGDELGAEPAPEEATGQRDVAAVVAETRAPDAPQPVSASVVRPTEGEPDASLRFAGGPETPLARPEPWLPEAPHLDGLVPTTGARRLSEEWALGETFDPRSRSWVIHRVHGIFEHVPGELGRIRAAVTTIGGAPRGDPPPVVAVLDPRLASREVRVEVNRGSEPGVAAWRDDPALGRPTQVDVREFGPDGVQITIVVFHAIDTRAETLDRFAEALPDEDRLFASLRGALGAPVRAIYRRGPADAHTTIAIARERTPAELAALERVSLDEEIEESVERLRLAEEPAQRRWQRRIEALMRGRRAFRLDREYMEVSEQPMWRNGDDEVFLLDDTLNVSRVVGGS